MGDVVAVPELLQCNLEEVAARALVLVEPLVGVVAHVPDGDVLVDAGHERLGSFLLRVGGVLLAVELLCAKTRRGVLLQLGCYASVKL